MRPLSRLRVLLPSLGQNAADLSVVQQTPVLHAACPRIHYHDSLPWRSRSVCSEHVVRISALTNPSPSHLDETKTSLIHEPVCHREQTGTSQRAEEGLLILVNIVTSHQHHRQKSMIEHAAMTVLDLSHSTKH